ncbi:MAG: leucyl aminopeptidase [Spirochaetia bacterium]|nr:leucyl aminopeptidase [Spirochaetia bacterium]
MQFRYEKGGEVEIVVVKEGEATIPKGQKLFSYLKEKELFKGELGEVYFDFSMEGEHLLFVGLGKEKHICAHSLRTAFFQAGKELMKHKIESVGCGLPRVEEIPFNLVTASIVEGLLQSEYAFEKHLKVKKVTPCIKEVFLDIDESKKEEASLVIKETENLIDGIFLARDLVNERAITMYPEVLATLAKENLEKLGIKVEIFDEKKIKELHMESFLAVAKGSDKEPKFIIMSYTGDSDSQEKIALVGKGITYDSGGYSIKPTSGMETMHSDMAGSATVIGTMMSIAKSKLKKNVVGIVAACENLISGKAYKPGDIIGSMAGKTIEINNTDAEGRLTLADALYYAATVVKADKIIDLATLTGACVVALGSSNSGAISNNDTLMQNLKRSSDKAGEPIWQLPSEPDYRKLLKGEFADLKNAPGREGGAITAGLFLEEFVNEVPWVHIDIAGTAYLDKPSGYLPKGATGIHVKTLYHLIKDE